MRRLILPILVLLLLANLVQAQNPAPIKAYGKVLQSKTWLTCRDFAKYALECTNLRLEDNPAKSIDLLPLVGKYVRIEGTWPHGGVPQCKRVVLTKVTAATEYLDASGSTPTPGGQIQFTLFGQVGTFQVLLMGSGQPQILPLGPLGSFHLPLAAGFFTILATPIPAPGSTLLKLPIPGNTSLKGVNLLFQSGAALIPPSMNTELLNVQCVSIK